MAKKLLLRKNQITGKGLTKPVGNAAHLDAGAWRDIGGTTGIIKGGMGDPAGITGIGIIVLEDNHFIRIHVREKRPALNRVIFKQYALE